MNILSFIGVIGVALYFICGYILVRVALNKEIALRGEISYVEIFINSVIGIFWIIPFFYFFMKKVIKEIKSN